ncbi:MAG: hypothetical protein JWM95_1385, partial [Gemmatimonadetes bacterium]|nr:hypothetical protein [Gemmatimonadota bacterium]
MPRAAAARARNARSEKAKAATPASRSGAPRVKASAGIFGVGQYEGARSDRGSMKNWNPRAGSPDADTVPDLLPLRARARDLARNAPLIAGALETKLTCMIGPGLVPHPRIDRKFLGLDDVAADEWQQQASRLWWAFAGNTRCDVRHRSNFAHITHVVAR